MAATAHDVRSEAPKPASSDREVHLLDRLSVLHKYRHAAGTVFIAAVSWLMLDSYTTVPQHRATARILIEDEGAGLPAEFVQTTGTPFADPELYMNTQYRILRGRELARRVAGKLDLDHVAEFNGRGPKPTSVAITIGRIKDAAKWPIRAMLQRGSASDAPPTEAPAASESSRERRYIDAIVGRSEVNAVRGSRLVDVSFSAADPQFAARAVNTLVAEYVDQNLAFKVQALEKSLAWIAGEVARQQQLVQEAERALADYRQQRNALSLNNNQNVVVSRLNRLNDEVSRVKTERIQKEALYKQVTEAGADRDTLVAIVQNPVVQSLKTKLTELQQNRSRLSERYGEKWPDVAKVTSDIATVQKQLDAELTKAVQSLKNDYQTAVAEERSLTAAYQEQTAAAQDLDRKSIDYTVLERNAESARKNYNDLLQQQNNLRVIANSRANNVRVVDRAEVPGAPFTPNHKNDWMFALAVGLVFALGTAFGLDYLDDTVKTPEDISRRLRLRFLGLVPSVRGERHPLISGPVPHDFSESFRSLRTALVSQSPSEGTRIIAVTSAQPLEGKTTTAVNLAFALAVGGSRVLLIDADMRRPSVHKALRVPNDRGLSQLIAGQARMREVVQRTHDPNLLVISAGRTPSNPSELLASERMRALVSGLETGPFDWVIIDTPPVLAVTDAVIVAPLVSSVTFVVGAEMTRWRLAQRAVETLVQGNPRGVMAILNKVDFTRNRYYYSRYYGSQYKNYYQQAPAA